MGEILLLISLYWMSFKLVQLLESSLGRNSSFQSFSKSFETQSTSPMTCHLLHFKLVPEYPNV